MRIDDDEVDLAYYDDEAAATSPDRVAYLLHDTWPLPTDAAEPSAIFNHDVPVRAVRLAPPGPESVFSVRLSWEFEGSGRNLCTAAAFARVVRRVSSP